MLNPYHTYHMCHIKAQNMIDMTSMIATALWHGLLRFLILFRKLDMQMLLWHPCLRPTNQLLGMQLHSQ